MKIPRNTRSIAGESNTLMDIELIRGNHGHGAKNAPQTTVASHRGNPAQALLEPQNQHSERVQEAVREIIDNTCNPIKMFDRIAAEVLPKFKGNKQDKNAANKELDTKVNEALMALGVAYHYPVMVAVRSKYRALAINMAREIERDYNCQTTLEKAMAENIAIAHVTIIDTSCLVRNATDVESVCIWSKHLDRANRQFLSAVMALKQMKQPALKVNIRAETAFVAQNQQVNKKQS